MVLPPVAFIAGCGAAVFSLLPRENLHVGYLCFRPTARLLCLFLVASLLPRENVHVGYPEAWVPRSRDSVFFCGTYGGYLGGLFHHSCLGKTDMSYYRDISGGDSILCRYIVTYCTIHPAHQGLYPIMLTVPAMFLGQK